MIASPPFKAVASPVVASIETIEGSEEDQVTVLSSSASAGVISTEKLVFSPLFKLTTLLGLIVTPSIGIKTFTLTVSVISSSAPPLTVTVAVPGFKAVIFPFSTLIKLSVWLTSHVIVSFSLVSTGLIFNVKSWVWFGKRVTFSSTISRDSRAT